MTGMMGVSVGVSKKGWGYQCRLALQSGAPCSGKPLTGR